jgi:hypothetical protein
MSKSEKVEKLVQIRLSRMDLQSLESFYVDIKTEELEQLSESILDEILEGEI